MKQMNPVQATPITVEPTTPEQAQRARITICANAENAEEAATLLAMLGLL